MLCHWRRLAFLATFPFARTSLMKPARKLRPSGIRRRHGAMDDTTIQQEAEQRRPGRGQERRRASPPSRGRRSIDRTAAKATSGEGEGWERPGATECGEAPRGRRRRTEQRPVPASQARAGRTRPPPPGKSANVGPLRTRGLILFAGYTGCRSRLVLEASGVPTHGRRRQRRHFDTIVCQGSPHEPIP